MKAAIFIDGGHLRVLVRKAGLQVMLVQFPRQRLARELLWHSDFQQPVNWPKQD